ncbi:HIT family protein [Bifidobacterium actinocoloniiforme DSM 22766]|uniref:HIT family protein n=1 Tax=Bifidobacterium actinocoloniiforme DSM 22766 TaxID=1437605 RepID=A0A086Z097_9BIFI|nr:histidine triad nucleotide-binding protein [Bifidobacterium actinocoloniiforme]AKV55200.1 HIT family hydrolase [Bifidobacterium actinocoloniiforme DSM 22766]KFI39947.1 HIT family protein [Bifidobacterium actinocoloniiforme DSM 22766]
MVESHAEDDCLFCGIIAGRVPSEKVYEDESLYAFKDVNPKAAVHVLIVPKRHYANVAELAAADPELLASMVIKAQDIADQAFHGAYRLIFNTGKDAGQSVFHVHAHVLTGEVMDE